MGGKYFDELLIPPLINWSAKIWRGEGGSPPCSAPLFRRPWIQHNDDHCHNGKNGQRQRHILSPDTTPWCHSCSTLTRIVFNWAPYWKMYRMDIKKCHKHLNWNMLETCSRFTVPLPPQRIWPNREMWWYKNEFITKFLTFSSFTICNCNKIWIGKIYENDVTKRFTVQIWLRRIIERQT